MKKLTSLSVDDFDVKVSFALITVLELLIALQAAGFVRRNSIVISSKQMNDRDGLVNRSRFICAGVALAVTALFTGCNSDDDNAVSTGGGNAQATPAPTLAPRPTNAPVATKPPSVVPTVSAVSNSPVVEGNIVQLLGVAQDIDGQIERYQWEQLSGPSVFINGATNLNATFNAPEVDAVGDAGTIEMRFRFTAWDNVDVLASTELSVQINDGNKPVADAGDDQTVFQGQEVILDAANSVDLNGGQIISYAWTQVRGQPAENFVNTNNREVRFNAPHVFRSVDMTFQLTVTDNEGNVSTDQHIVTVLGNLEEAPQDEDVFLTFINRNSEKFFETTEDGEAYYRTIDRSGEKTTVASWYASNGFVIDFENPNYEQACYFNKADVGLGRLARMRIVGNGIVAAAVENYATVEEACAAMENNNTVGLIATTAMEFAPPDDDFGEQSFSTFFIYGEDGTRTPTINMDGRGERVAPGMCATCHGGAPNDVVAGVYPDDGNLNSVFIPFNLNTLEFSDQPGFTKNDQEEAFKEMNRIVLETIPSGNFVSTDAGAYTGVAMREVVEGWYGGRGLPRSRFDDDFIPQGWRPENQGGPQGVPYYAEELYLDVIEPNCIICHLVRGSELNDTVDFSSFDKFMEFEEEIIDLVFKQGTMPDSLITQQNFWSQEEGTAPALKLAAALNYDPTGRIDDGQGDLPGKPVAKIAAPLEAPSRDLIQLSGAGSTFESFYEWTITESPAGSSPRLIGATTATPVLDVDVDGEYTVELIVGNLNNDRSLPVSTTINARRDLQPLRFQEDVYEVVDINCANICHRRNGTAGIPIEFDNLATAHEFMVQYVNFDDPLNSPILRKPSGNNHYGGTINGFDLNGDHSNYDIMVRWILEGAERN